MQNINNNSFQKISQKIISKHLEVEKFFAEKFLEFPPLFYNSIDLRRSGSKIAAIDTNCFPAGFNNILGHSKEVAKKIVDDFFDKNPVVEIREARRVLIIPENHTRNFRYLENVVNLCEIISGTREVKVGSLIPDLEDKAIIGLESGASVELNPLVRNGDRIATKDGFVPDFILLNNDLTSGIPDILQNVTIPVEPSPSLGWHSRTKSNHFTIYNRLAEELALILEIDPWLISSFHRSCHDVDFKEPDKEVGGIRCLAKYVDELLNLLKKKYQEHGIEEEPYCFIKADNGTYGMAVWPVFSREDVLEINKKERNKMNMLKESVQNTQVMIQEGIRTADLIDGKVAEPMIYMMNGSVIGNLFRVNETRDESISLNAAGASFVDLRNLSESELAIGGSKDEMSAIYSVIARLAALASSIEKFNSNKK